MAKVECELMTQDAIDVEIAGKGVVLQDKSVDVEIAGKGVVLQDKSVDVEYNGTIVVAPDDGFDGLSGVEINTNVQKRFECGDATFAPVSGVSSFLVIKQLETLNASCWDTSKVSNMGYKFNSNFTNLRKLDVSCWITSRVTTIEYIFGGCRKLEQLNISGWDTSNVTNITGVFDTCSSLPSVDISGWNVSNVISSNKLFCRCISLRTLIGDKTLADVENGTVVLRGMKSTILAESSPLRFSSILAIANGIADLTGATAQTLTISANSYNYMYNDDDTTPTADVIAERQARIAAICAAKNWNFAH